MSLPRYSRYADDTNNSYLPAGNRRPRPLSALPSPPVSPPVSPPDGPSFPEPTISGNPIPLFPYERSISLPPHNRRELPARKRAQRPPLQPNGFATQTAPPRGLPRLSAATAHMQHFKIGASEMYQLQSQSSTAVPPDFQAPMRLTEDELTESIALQRFHDNRLHVEDRFWHTVVPKSFQQRLSAKERARQEEMFGIIASEQTYVLDLNLWLTVYRDPLQGQNLFVPHVLDSFIKDVFSNIEKIKRRHEGLLQALFETQRRNYYQVHSIMDDLLEAVSNAEFQRAYVDYISNIDIAMARHNREVKRNPAYAEFVSAEAATARDSRIRKLDFSSFLQRANRRLGQLKLQVDQVRKKTEFDHFDQHGHLEMVLDILHRTVMRGQAKGQGQAEQNALKAFRESLSNPPWEYADLGLGQKYRAIKFEGTLSQVYPLSSVPVYTVLLDNYLVFTHPGQEGENYRRIVHKPIPLELLDAQLESGPVPSRNRVTSLLSRHDDAQIVRISIKRDGVEVIRLGTGSKGLAEKWVDRILEEVTLRKFDIDANKRVFFNPRDTSPHRLINQGDLVSACVLEYEDTCYVVCATATGIFVGQRDDIYAFRLVRPLSGITQLISIPGMHDLIVLHGGSLSRVSIVGLLSSNRRSSFLEQSSVDILDPDDGPVLAVCGGVVEGRSIVAYTNKHFVRKRLHLYVYDLSSRELKRVCEPVPISDSITDISIVSGAVFLVGKECLVVKYPISYSPTVSSWPDFGSGYVDTTGLQARCSSARFLCAIKAASDRILLVYDTHGCFVTSSGQPISLPRMYEWEITPTTASYCDKHIVLFSHDKAEVRDSEDGRLLQILDMPNMRLLYPSLNYSTSEKVLMATSRPDNRHKSLLGELLPTTLVSSPILN